MSDIHDILELERPNTPEISKATILGLRSNVPIKKKEKDVMRRPEGMHRELFALLYSTDSNKELPPLLQTDATPQQGYKSNKARLGMRRVRPWSWVQFCNPARKDGALLCHWRRVADQGKEYPFAQFDKHLEILQYTDSEYSEHLSSDCWSRADSDTLMQLCHQFDLRWPIIHDRWPHNSSGTKWSDQDSNNSARTIENLKERYYHISNTLKKARSLTGADGKQVHYDAELERRRKLQLTKLWDRTPKQLEEEQQLVGELRRIEARKKERERKTQDLHKLIAGGEGGAGEHATTTRKYNKTNKTKKLGINKMAKQDSMGSGSSMGGSSSSMTGVGGGSSITEGIRFPELRLSGVALRSHTLKLPASLGQKKLKAIEQLLNELNIEHNPMPVEELCGNFNDLRSDLVILYELRTVLNNYVFELQTLKHQYETVKPSQSLAIPSVLTVTSNGSSNGEESPSKTRGFSEMLDAVANSPSTPNRKRKAALEQSNILKKIKART